MPLARAGVWNLQSRVGMARATTLVPVLAQSRQTRAVEGLGALATSTRGSATIEKVFMIALFAFVAAVGLDLFGRAARFALFIQAREISRYSVKL